MKTKEELIALKNEVEALNAKLAELTEDELKMVAGAGGRTDIEVIITHESSTLEDRGKDFYIG